MRACEGFPVNDVDRLFPRSRRMRHCLKKGTAGSSQGVESQDCGCGTGIISQPEDETDCGHERLGVMSGALGGSDLRCILQTSRNLELSHANIFYLLTFFLHDLYNCATFLNDQKNT